MRLHYIKMPHLQKDDWVFAGVLDKELLEVGTARGQDELVCLERPGLSGQRDIHEKLLLEASSRESEKYGKDFLTLQSSLKTTLSCSL